MFTRVVKSEFGEIGFLPRLPRNKVRGLFTFRQGGVSTTPYSSLNLGLHVSDDVEAVLENRRRCTSILGGDLCDWVVAEQVHSNVVYPVLASDRGRGAHAHESAIAGADGLVTNEAGITLVVFAADCVPLLFYDPKQSVIGTAHSGWKGTVGHIAVNVVNKMVELYGSDPLDIQVWMGPSIRRCCYEVDERVAQMVRDEFGNKYLLPRFGKTNKYYFGMQRCIEADLLARGIVHSNIIDTGVCTNCRTDRFFSHRKESGQTGRILGAIRLSDSTPK